VKVKLSITINNKTLKMIDEHIKSQRFRNKSHAIEFAVMKLLENKISTEKNVNKTDNVNNKNDNNNHTKDGNFADNKINDTFSNIINTKRKEGETNV